MPTAATNSNTHDPLAFIPDSETLKQQIAELVRRTNILRRLVRIAREREADLLAGIATPQVKGVAK